MDYMYVSGDPNGRTEDILTLTSKFFGQKSIHLGRATASLSLSENN